MPNICNKSHKTTKAYIKASADFLPTSTNFFQSFPTLTNSYQLFPKKILTSTNFYSLLSIFTNFTHLPTPIYKEKEQALSVWWLLTSSSRKKLKTQTNMILNLNRMIMQFHQRGREEDHAGCNNMMHGRWDQTYSIIKRN